MKEREKERKNIEGKKGENEKVQRNWCDLEEGCQRGRKAG